MAASQVQAKACPHPISAGIDAHPLPPPVYRPQPLATVQMNTGKSGPVVSAAPSSPGPLPARRSPPANSVVQPYTIIPRKDQGRNYWRGLDADLRVSDDGRMAVKHTPVTPLGTNEFQVLYATKDLIREIQTALKAVKSVFKVERKSSTLKGPAPDGSGIMKLYEVEITNQEIPGGCTFQVCNANMFHLMGAYRKRKFKRTPYTYFESPVGGQQEISSQHTMSEGMKAVLEEMTGEKGREGRQIYEGIKKKEKNRQALLYGINQYASPEIGEGIGIFSAHGGSDGEGHFAGVIAKSGHDIVLIENYVGNPGGTNMQGMGDINPNWYLRMFGPLKRRRFRRDIDQTFYGENLLLNEYGPTPLVARFTSH